MLLPALSGCWDRSEPEDDFYVISLAPGLPGATAASSPGALSSGLLTAHANTLTQAMHVLNGGTTRRLIYHHLQAVVFGEDLARSGLEPLVMELLRNPELRGSVAVFQGRGRATDLLQNQLPIGEVNPAKMVEGYVLQAKQLHLAPPVRLLRFRNRMAAPGGDPFLPAVALNPNVLAGQPEPQRTADSAVAGELARGGGNPVD